MALKNKDRAVAQLLREAVQHEGKVTSHFEMFLGIVTLSQSGYDGKCRDRGREVGEG